MLPLLLLDHELVQHFTDKGTPLRFPLSSIRQDRVDGMLGGMPYRKPGGNYLYNPEDVEAWVRNLPVYRGGMGKVKTLRMGRPSHEEKSRAAKLGITIPELRAREFHQASKKNGGV